MLARVNSLIFCLVIAVFGNTMSASASCNPGAAISNASAKAAYDKGVALYRLGTPHDLVKAREQFNKVLELVPGNTAAASAIAKIYARAVHAMFEHSHLLGFPWFEGTSRTWKFLQQVHANPDKDFFITMSRMTLKRHQPHRAIAAAQKALEHCPTDGEAMNALAEAQIFAGNTQDGLELAQKAMQAGTHLLAQSSYLIGLAEFANGNIEASVEAIERARDLAPREVQYLGVLAAGYGLLGREDDGAKAFEKFKPTELNFILHEALSLFPFDELETLDRLAEGFRKARVTVRTAGYLKLHAGTRMTGAEIKSALFGKKIDGVRFWDGASAFPWGQRRNENGDVEHKGYNVQPGIGSGHTGSARIDGNELCETWPHLAPDVELCFSFFRIEDRIGRIKWGEYAMVTDSAPHPFKVSE